MSASRWLPAFFAVAACSWMPHWSCHYYRLETSSSFIVGSWSFAPLDSMLSMVVYSGLIGLNIAAVVVTRARPVAALLSGLGHSAIGVVHAVRLSRPFRFEVFDHAWPLGASAREVAILLGFGILCFFVAWYTFRMRMADARSNQDRSARSNEADAAALKRRWGESIERLYSESTHLVHVDNVFWQVNAIINANPALRGGGVFGEWIRDCYGSRIIVGIRTLVGRRKGTLSLWRLLDELSLRGSDVFDRAHFRAWYPEAEFLGDADFEERAGEGNERIPPEMFRRDRDDLKQATAKVERIANCLITHLAEDPATEPLTYREIRDGIRTVERVMRKYLLLINGHYLDPAPPQILRDWIYVFRMPWLPAGAEPPSYERLDEGELNNP